jgi:hypothetical protein
MNVYTYSHARQNFSNVLKHASKEAEVVIRRKDGSMFSIKPQEQNKSPLDVRELKQRYRLAKLLK